MSQNFSGRRNIILFLLISVTLLLYIYISLNPTNNPTKKLHIGITQWPGFEYLFIAKKQKFFEQVGLDIELVELSSLSEVRRAFERGKIDGMTATLVEVLEAYKYSGRIAQSVLVTSYSKGADEILASQNIKSMRDLRGKKIGLVAGSFSAYLVNYALAMNDIKESEVILMPMELHKLTSSLKSGKVDAITSYPPKSILIKKQLNTNVIFSSASIAQNILDVIALDKNILEKTPDLQNKFIEAWGLTLDYVSKNTEESYSTLAERLYISAEDFKKAMNNIHLVNKAEQDAYLNDVDALTKCFKNTGDIVLRHLDLENFDYSRFIFQNENKSLN